MLIFKRNRRRLKCRKVSAIEIIKSFIERYTEIERENRILLEKMTNIMNSNP